MARKIPPRRVPRDREQQRAISSGSIFGGSSIPGAHTHVEADITDLGPYLLLTGGTLTGATTINVAADAASFLHIGEASTARGSAQQGNLRLWSEDAVGTITHATIFNTGSNLSIAHQTGAVQINSPLDVISGNEFRVRDTGNTDWGEWDHDGTDFTLDCTNTTDYNLINMDIVKVAADLQVQIGHALRVYDGSQLDWAEWSHDGTDFNLALTNTTDYNITGATLKLNSNPGIHIQNAVAQILLEETDAAANNKVWSMRADAEQFQCRMHNDAVSNSAAWLTVDRTLNVVDLITLSGPTKVGNFGAQGTTPITKPTVTGSAAGNAALASLLTALASYGLITDSSS